MYKKLISALLAGSIAITVLFATSFAATPTEYSLKEAFSSYFEIGNIMEPGQTASSAITDMYKHHYSTVTAENAMKPAYLASTQGTYTYSNADRITDWAEANGIDVHGHALVWHSQSAAWLTTGATRATAKTNMETYINNVAGHYRGKVVSWDVVNEAFRDDASGAGAWEDDLRTNDSPWYTAYANGATGNESAADYIYDAFVFARLADDGAKLYYNDYNETSYGKRTAIAKMVNDLNTRWASDPRNTNTNRLLIEGIGMQSHYYTKDNNLIDNVRATIELFKSTGAEVIVSELDVAIGTWQNYRTYEKTEADYIEQADIYKQLFELYMQYSQYIPRVVFWGKADNQSWRSEGDPLPFAANYVPKLAYNEIMSLVLTPPYTAPTTTEATTTGDTTTEATTTTTQATTTTTQATTTTTQATTTTTTQAEVAPPAVGGGGGGGGGGSAGGGGATAQSTANSVSKDTVTVNDITTKVNSSGTAVMSANVKSDVGKISGSAKITFDSTAVLKYVNDSDVEKVQLTVTGAAVDDTVMINDNVINRAKFMGKDIVVVVKNNSGKITSTWTIDADDKTKVTSDVAFFASAVPSEDDKKVNSAVSKINSKNNGIVFSLSTEVPTSTNARVNVSDLLGNETDVKAGQTLYLYKYNEKTGKFEETVQNKVKVSSTGNITINNVENAKYVALTSSLGAKNITPLTSQVFASVKGNSKKGSSATINISAPQGVDIVKTIDKDSKNLQVKNTFTSSDKSVATVNSNGKITFKEKGKVSITIKREFSNGKTITSKINLTVS